MKRVLTATCLAATFAVGLAAQSTGTSGTAGTATSQDPSTAGQRGGGPRTVTGCLRAGDTAGSYMLTDVVMQGGGGDRGGDATSTGAHAPRPAPTATSGTAHRSAERARGGADEHHVERRLRRRSQAARRPQDRSDRDDGGRTRPWRRSDRLRDGHRDRDRRDDRRRRHDRWRGHDGRLGNRHGDGHVRRSGHGTRRPRSLTVTSIRMISESCS